MSIHSVLGPSMIRSEGGKLVGFVFVNTDRPIADYVAEAKRIVANEAKLPPGTRLAWVGQFKYFERAKARLKWMIPLTLGIVFTLLLDAETRAASGRAKPAGQPRRRVELQYLMPLLRSE